MSNTTLEELEIEELTEKLMLKLGPKIEGNESLNKNMMSAMIIDDCESYSNTNILNFNCESDQNYNEVTKNPNDFDQSFQNSTSSLDKRKLKPDQLNRYNNNHIINQIQFNRSSSLPPLNKNNNNKGLNLLKNKNRTKDTNYNSEQYMHSSFSLPSQELNRNVYTSTLKKMNTANTEEFIRLIFNIIIVFITLYIIFGIIFVIKNDIESKIQISITNILDEMSLCSKHYVENKCQPEYRVPAMESKCTEWERCMSQNPTIIARKSIFTAQIIGEIINTFFDQISLKSALFIFGFIIALIVGNYFVISSTFNFNKSVSHTGNSLELLSSAKNN
ncbi:hypothetical protein OJ253_2163 [Cryptosporidium canis]|uniref:Brl1/Brr6 domain-containing protein n=1 Tax=Cryptosporidium canis TaxID=195482 RepID=A0A9D5DI07_9CRYT|nr:hypothetical protein OJ253_2163 [Cryptosporidium canis]